VALSEGYKVNYPYDRYRCELLAAQSNWPAENLTMIAWSGPLEFFAGDITVGDITTRGNSALRGVSLPVTGAAISSQGYAQSNQVIIPGITIGATITYFTMVRTMGTTAASHLLLYIDTAWELPWTPNGLDLPVQPDWLSMKGWFRG
jgi:hypothetical protein